MSQDQDSLWAAAAAACERLAAGLAPDGQPNYTDADHLCDVLEALGREPAPRPTAEFVRHAAAAATAAALLAAARPIAVPTSEADLRREVNRWSTAGYTAVLLLRAVCQGCLQGLETKQAFALASAFLVFTDGVPPALLVLWGALQQPAVRLSDLPTEALALAGRTCTAIAQTLNITVTQRDRSAGAEQAAAGAAAQPRPVDRLLRSTAARPAHIVAALDNLTTLMQLGSPYAAHSQEGRTAMNEWLGLATFVLTDKLCSEEQRRVEQQPQLQYKVATLAVAFIRDRLLHARACCADADSLQTWQSQLARAADMLTSSLLLPVTAPLLASLGGAGDSIDGDEPGDLVSAATHGLEAALDEVAAGELVTAAAAATRALQLAAFAADCCAAAGAGAGLQPAAGARQVAIIGHSGSGLAHRQLRLLLRSHSLAPAALAAVDAAVQHGVLGARPGHGAEARQAKARADKALLSIGRFVSWLGTSGAQVEERVLAERPAEAASSAAAAWLLLTRRLLQLHAEHAGGGGAAPAPKALQLYLDSLAQGSRGLANLHLQATVLGESSRQQEGATAGGSLGTASTAGTAGAAPEPEAALAELPTIQQLATAVCVLAHTVAAVGTQQNTGSLRHPFCCGEGEPAAVGVLEQLESAVNGLNRVLEGSRPSPPSGHGATIAAESPFAADRRLGVTLQELTAAGAALLDAVAALPAVVGARSSGRPLGPDLSQALRSLAISAQMVARLAQRCGQQAASAEADRVFGRALKLAMDAGAQPQLLIASWMAVAPMLRQPRPAGLELVATGALDTAVAWLHAWLASLPGGWTEGWQPIAMMAVQSGIAAALLSAAPLLVPPREPGSAPASGAALEAAAAQQVAQHLGLWGQAAQAATALLVRRWTTDPAQADRCLHQLVDLVSSLGGQMEEVNALVDALLPRLRQLAAEQGRASSAVTQQVALERCAALRRRRCAHLGCTNVPLLLGVGPGGGEQPKSYKCAGCHAVRFCSEACSRADWRVHKLACRQLAAARAAEPAGGEQEA